VGDSQAALTADGRFSRHCRVPSGRFVVVAE
jgi:hypothetical protein